MCKADCDGPGLGSFLGAEFVVVTVDTHTPHTQHTHTHTLNAAKRWVPDGPTYGCALRPHAIRARALIHSPSFPGADSRAS